MDSDRHSNRDTSCWAIPRKGSVDRWVGQNEEDEAGHQQEHLNRGSMYTIETFHSARDDGNQSKEDDEGEKLDTDGECEVQVAVAELSDSSTSNIMEGMADNNNNNNNAEVPYHVFTNRKKWELVLIVSLAGLFSSLSSNIYFPALGAIAEVRPQENKKGDIADASRPFTPKSRWYR